MFDGFEQQKDEQARKRWFASGGISLLIYALVGVGVVFLAKQTVSHATEEPAVDVTFRATVEPEQKAPPPPPPPPPPKTRAPRAKKPGKPAPASPTVIPEARPEEGDPAAGGPGEVIEEFGDGGEGGVLDTPPPPPPPPPKVERVPDPIDEVDPSVAPAKAVAGNAAPAYPKEARQKGLEGDVILRVRISERGEVLEVEVLRGDEPFASAAIAAVKTWRYRPATVDGRAVAVSKKVRIPFRIQG